MAEFSLTHRFDCSPEEYWEVVESPDFLKRLGSELDATVEVIDGGGEEVQLWRVTYARELPGVMKKVLGVDQFQFDLRRELQGTKAPWKLTTSFLKDRVDAAGLIVVDGQAGGCERRVEGEVTIRLALMGKKMERKLSERIEQFYEASATVVAELI